MTMAPVLHSFAYAVDFLREQVVDVAAVDMVAQPGGVRDHHCSIRQAMRYSPPLAVPLANSEGTSSWRRLPQ